MLEVGGRESALFSCDECISVWRLEGREFELPLTFAVDASGGVFDPETGGPFQNP